MAKNFLDRLGEAYDEDLFNDLIPTVKHKSGKKEETAKTGQTRRRKKFIKNIEQALEGQIPKKMETSSSEKKFLAAMDGALEDKAFDNVFPTKRANKDSSNKGDDYIPFQTAISTTIFNRAKSIAIQKGIRIKDVINIALQWYLDNEYSPNK